MSCGSPPANENFYPKIEIKDSSEFPFSTAEPPEFQADISLRIGETVTEYHYYKKGRDRRIDHLINGTVAKTYLLSDKFYVIDHIKREIEIKERGTEDPKDIAVSPYRSPAFTSPVRYRFEKIGSDGNLVTYKIDTGSAGDIDNRVTVDSSKGLIVKQEFRGAISTSIYELTNLKLSVEDREFILPSGYKTVTVK